MLKLRFVGLGSGQEYFINVNIEDFEGLETEARKFLETFPDGGEGFLVFLTDGLFLQNHPLGFYPGFQIYLKENPCEEHLLEEVKEYFVARLLFHIFEDVLESLLTLAIMF